MPLDAPATLIPHANPKFLLYVKSRHNPPFLLKLIAVIIKITSKIFNFFIFWSKKSKPLPAKQVER